MEYISLKEIPNEVKIAILKELGYGSDGIFVLEKDGQKKIDPYTDDEIKIDNMVIVPGSEVILDNNPLSIAGYFEDHGEII